MSLSAAAPVAAMASAIMWLRPSAASAPAAMSASEMRRSSPLSAMIRLGIWSGPVFVVEWSVKNCVSHSATCCTEAFASPSSLRNWPSRISKPM